MTATIEWTERPNNSNFPEYGSKQSRRLTPRLETYVDGEFEYTFDKSAHANDWWAKRPGQEDVCKVKIKFEYTVESQGMSLEYNLPSSLKSKTHKP